jgi:hypothetical protein
MVRTIVGLGSSFSVDPDTQLTKSRMRTHPIKKYKANENNKQNTYPKKKKQKQTIDKK